MAKTEKVNGNSRRLTQILVTIGIAVAAVLLTLVTTHAGRLNNLEVDNATLKANVGHILEDVKEIKLMVRELKQ